jgi:hypothetical protein
MEARMRSFAKRPLLVLATSTALLTGLSVAGLPQAHGAGVQALVSEGSPTGLHPWRRLVGCSRFHSLLRFEWVFLRCGER